MPHYPLKPEQEGRSRLDFEYDPYRGGFTLHFGMFDRRNNLRLFDGSVTAYLNEEGKILALESYWDHGGLPIRSLHAGLGRTQPKFFGDPFDVAGQDLFTPIFQFHQQPDRLTLWFGTEKDMPLPHWTVQRHPELRVALYFSSRKAKGGWPVPGVGGRGECNMLAGIEVALEKTVARYPISLMRFFIEDFKG